MFVLEKIDKSDIGAFVPPKLPIEPNIEATLGATLS